MAYRMNAGCEMATSDEISPMISSCSGITEGPRRYAGKAESWSDVTALSLVIGNMGGG